jgi:uncharacterized protein
MYGSGIVGKKLHGFVCAGSKQKRQPSGASVMESVTITQVNLGSQGEYRAHVPGSEQLGRLIWITRNGARVAEHTIVPPELGGRGIGSQLVEALIADARKQHFKIVPECSFVAAAFGRHPDWADLLV